MKSALSVQANVAVDTKSNFKGALFVWKFPCLKKKNWSKNAQFRYGMTGKFFLTFPGKIFLVPFQYPKCPWKPVPPPQSFDASYPPVFNHYLSVHLYHNKIALS
jgi:hypothetical protein